MESGAVRHNFERDPPKNHPCQFCFNFRGEDINVKIYNDTQQTPSDGKCSPGYSGSVSCQSSLLFKKNIFLIHFHIWSYVELQSIKIRHKIKSKYFFWVLVPFDLQSYSEIAGGTTNLFQELNWKKKLQKKSELILTRGSSEQASFTWFIHCLGSNQFPIVKQCLVVSTNLDTHARTRQSNDYSCTVTIQSIF